MVFEVVLRVSWICLLVLSSGACFPFKKDYKYPYARASTTGAPASELFYDSPPETSSSGPATAGPPTGNQSPPSKTAGSPPRYQLNRYVGGLDSSASRPAPVAPPKVPGYFAYAPPAGGALRNSPPGTSVLGPGSYQARPAAGAESSSSPNRMQSLVSPQFSVWDAAAVMPPRQQGRPPGPAPSTVLIQSRNGYWRAAVRSSSSRYSPENPALRSPGPGSKGLQR